MKWCGKWDEIHVIWMARSCHWSLGVMSLPFHSSPALYFFPMPALYFFACLLYVLSISLLPYADVLAISFLPSHIFLWLPVNVYAISLLPRATFHSLPSVMFLLFHCYLGLYFIACLGWCLCHFISCLGRYFYHFIPTQGYISLLA